jgi:hypothetical protein
VDEFNEKQVHFFFANSSAILILLSHIRKINLFPPESLKKKVPARRRQGFFSFLPSGKGIKKLKNIPSK